MRKTRDKSAGRYWLGRLRAGTLLVQFCRPALLDSLVEWGPSAPVGRENQVWHALATFASDTRSQHWLLDLAGDCMHLSCASSKLRR